MSKNEKVKGENVKELTFDVKELNLDERIEFNNIVTEKGYSKLSFGDFVKMVRIGTTLTDDDINQFTDVEIISVSNRCYEVINKKKLKK